MKSLRGRTKRQGRIGLFIPRSEGLRLAMFASILCAPVSLLAQSTFGSLRGLVQDGSGATIPQTKIALQNVDENTERVVTTDDAGSFTLENVKAGKYRLLADHDGFAETVVSNIAVNARQDVRLSVALTIATQATSVEVISSGSEINTENAELGDIKDNKQITQMPLNNRATTTSPLGALALSPNVQQDSSGNIALGGASSSMVNFSVDGISTVNVRQNGALQDAYPSQEGIASVKVTASNNSAEFSQVGDVTFTTKSGSNRFHGSAFEYLQNDALDASPYGFSAKAPKRFNTFGFSLSGPVRIPHVYDGKNKTFFFADYEANRRTTAVAQQFLVPSQAERNGDLTSLGAASIAPSQISPTARAVLSYYPLPNVDSGNGYNYSNFQRIPARTDGADLRVDQTINSKQSAYARFSRKNITSNFANPLLPNDVDSIHNRSLLISHTYTLTPRLLNEFRFGFTNVTTSVAFPIQGSDALSQLGLQGVNISQHPTSAAFPAFNFSAGFGFTPIGRDKAGVTQSKTMQFSDNLTYTVGKHTFKGGIDVRRVRYFDIETFLASDDFGQFTFQPTFTGSAFGDFLTGAPTTVFFAVSSPDVAGATNQYSFFAQDEFQISSKLTMSYGLRWQLLPSFQEDGGDLANFDPTTNSVIVPDKLSSTLVAKNLQSSNLAFRQSFNSCDLNNRALACTQYKTASEAGLPQGLRNTYKRNLQPRISFAYRPFGDTNTVVRAGFGIFTVTNLGPLSFNNSGNPTSNLHTYTNSQTAAGQPLIRFPNTAPPSTGVQYGGGSLDQAVDPNYRDPQASQWNVTVERQLTKADTLRVSYVSMHTSRLSTTEDANQIHASTTPYTIAPENTASPYVDARAPFPNWFEIYDTLNHGKANYRALEIEESHRMAHGLYLNANYTLAKNQANNQGDTPSAFAGEVNYGIVVADRFNLNQNYGNVQGTRRNRFLLSGLYQLPVGEGRAYLNHGGALSQLVGGWDVNTVTLLQSGPWQTPSISAGGVHEGIANDQSNTNIVGRGGSLRPDVVSANYAGGRSRSAFYNASAFVPTPKGAGRIGNAGVGILQGPGTAAVSLGVAKNFALREGIKVRFESSFTNILNRTNFAPPVTQIDDSRFGQLTAAQTAENAGNRTGQAALRIDF